MTTEERYEGGITPKPGEIWEEQDGTLLVRDMDGTWHSFGNDVHIHDDNEFIEYPLRRRFDMHGRPDDDNVFKALRYPNATAFAPRADFEIYRRTHRWPDHRS